MAALVAVNTVPLAGALFLGWDAAAIILLYWMENVVTGFYNVLRMVFWKAEVPAAHLVKLFIIPFFCIHFGGFCAGHGFFLLAFFKVGGGMQHFFPEPAWPGPLVFVQLLIAVISRLWQSLPAGMIWPVIGLFASHGISFVQNYLLGGEYRSASIGKLMGRPYARIVLLHVAIIAGGLPVMLLGSPIPLLCILIVLKIALDVHMHRRSHRAASEEEGPPDPTQEAHAKA